MKITLGDVYFVYQSNTFRSEKTESKIIFVSLLVKKNRSIQML